MQPLQFVPSITCYSKKDDVMTTITLNDSMLTVAVIESDRITVITACIKTALQKNENKRVTIKANGFQICNIYMYSRETVYYFGKLICLP